MRLPEPLLRLPLRFDPAALAAEVAALPAEAWVPHPDKLPGNEAVRLITPGGEMSEGTTGAMAPTRFLLACPTLMDALAAIGVPWGRSRLMRLAGGAVVPPHVDTNFYWRKHVRIHIPIVTTPEVLFTCAGKTVHMAPGETWIFDTFSRHRVHNGGTAPRTHLVADTVGDERLWQLIDDAARGLPPQLYNGAPGSGRAALAFECGEPPEVMSPWEVRYHVGFLKDHARPAPQLDPVLARLDRFVAGWTGVWARFGPTPQGVPAFRALLAALDRDLGTLGGERLTLRNELPVYRQIAELLFNADASLATAGTAAAAR